MRTIREKLAAVSLLGILLLMAGCLISGTFVVTIFIGPDDFTTFTGFYHYEVDLSTNSDWQERKDDIQNIDVIGVEMWLTNSSDAAATFDVWIDDINEPAYTSIAAVDSNATQILEDIHIDPGMNHVTYAESLPQIQNVATLKDLAETGEFHYYGASTLGAMFVLDSARIIVTVSAGS
jgi:hypothetical protein